MAFKIAQFEAALLRLKLQASEMETLLVGMKQLAAASGIPVHETAPAVNPAPAAGNVVRTAKPPAARPATPTGAPPLAANGARSVQ